MITLLCALSSDRGSAAFSTHKLGKMLATLIISLLVQIFSLMCSCFSWVLTAPGCVVVALSITISLRSRNSSQGGDCEPQAAVA